MQGLLLVLSLIVQGADAGRIQTGTVTGVLRDITGKPAAGVRVSAMAEPDPNALTADALFGVSQTDEAGRYRLENVPPGRYYIVAGRVAAPTFYPGGLNPALARMITVAAGVDITGMDFAVTEESTCQPLGVSVGGLAIIQSAGSISLIDAQAALAGAAQAGNTLAEDQLRRLIVQMSAGCAPSGPVRLTVRGTVAVENGELPTLGRRGSVLAKRTFDGAEARADIQGDGSFLLNMVDGAYALSVVPPLGYAMKSIASRTTDLQAQPLTVDRTQPLPDIQVKLTQTTPRVTLRGRIVEEKTRQHVDGGTVELTGPGLRASFNLTPEGTFEIKGLAGSSYTLNIWIFGHSRVQETVVVGDRDLSVELSTLKLY